MNTKSTENPPLPDDNYVDSHLEHLRNKEGADDVDKKLNTDKEIGDYVDPHLQQLRDREKQRLIEEKREELREVLKKEAFPSKENTIWEKPVAEEEEVDMDTFLGTKEVEETADVLPVAQEPVQKKNRFQRALSWAKGIIKSPEAKMVGTAIVAATPTMAHTTAEKVFAGERLSMVSTFNDSTKHAMNTIDFNTARKVTEKPEGYKEIKKDNKTYFYKITESKKNGGEVAKPIAKKTVKKQEHRLTPKKHVTLNKGEGFHQAEKTKDLDLVYVVEENQDTKPEQPDPFAAFAKDGEAIYAPNGRIAAEVFYQVRSSNDIKDGGMANTQHKNALIRLRNDNGWTGEYVIVTPEKFAELFGGSHSFQSNEKIEEVKALFAASAPSSESDIAVNTK